jgi:hypothetical protein
MSAPKDSNPVRSFIAQDKDKQTVYRISERYLFKDQVVKSVLSLSNVWPLKLEGQHSVSFLSRYYKKEKRRVIGLSGDIGFEEYLRSNQYELWRAYSHAMSESVKSPEFPQSRFVNGIKFAPQAAVIVTLETESPPNAMVVCYVSPKMDKNKQVQYVPPKYLEVVDMSVHCGFHEMSIPEHVQRSLDPARMVPASEEFQACLRETLEKAIHVPPQNLSSAMASRLGPLTTSREVESIPQSLKVTFLNLPTTQGANQGAGLKTSDLDYIPFPGMVPAKLLKRVEESSKRKSLSGMDLRDAINRKKLARLSENAKRALQRFAQKELTIFRYSKRPEIFISKNEEHLDWYQQHVGMGPDLESEGHSCTVDTSMAFLSREISFHENTVIPMLESDRFEYRIGPPTTLSAIEEHVRYHSNMDSSRKTYVCIKPEDFKAVQKDMENDHYFQEIIKWGFYTIYIFPPSYENIVEHGVPRQTRFALPEIFAMSDPWGNTLIIPVIADCGHSLSQREALFGFFQHEENDSHNIFADACTHPPYIFGMDVPSFIRKFIARNPDIIAVTFKTHAPEPSCDDHGVLERLEKMNIELPAYVDIINFIPILQPQWNASLIGQRFRL